jgi:hypothetical protein
MDQNLLINSYLAYKKSSIRRRLFDIGFGGWICRKNNLSGKLSNEFFIHGKYYGYYGQEEKDYFSNFDEYEYFTEKTLLINSDWSGFHYHFSVLDLIYEDLDIVNNKIYYQNMFINQKILKQINIFTTEHYKKEHIKGILELYNKTNNFIKLS